MVKTIIKPKEVTNVDIFHKGNYVISSMGGIVLITATTNSTIFEGVVVHTSTSFLHILAHYRTDWLKTCFEQFTGEIITTVE